MSIKISIIIPTYNRLKQIDQCLQSITHISYPYKDFEVIVVDDGSAIPLDSLVKKYKDQLPIRWIRQANSGPGTARNTGAKAARGEILVFTDDDCRVHPDYLKEISSFFKHQKEAVVGGKIVNDLPKNPFSTTSQLLVDYLYHFYNRNAHNAYFLTSNNLAVPTTLFAKLNGFNIHFGTAAGEDRDFCDRAIFEGYSIQYFPKAIIFHRHNMNFKAFWKQHFEYGKGAYCYHKFRAERRVAPFKIEPFSFYWQLINFPFRRKVQPTNVIIALLLCLTQLANAFGFFANALWYKPQVKN